jgi:hypothetical protein
VLHRNGGQDLGAGANRTPSPSRPYARPAGRAPTIGPAAVAFAHRNNLLVVQTAPMLLHGAALDHQHSRHARCRHVQNEEKKS